MEAKRTKLQKFKSFAFALCGWLFVWVVSVQILSQFVYSESISIGNCQIKAGMFYVIGINCGEALSPFSWIVTLASASVMPMNLFFYGLRGLIENTGPYSFTGVFQWLLYSTPIILISWAGFKFWHKKSILVATLMTATFVDLSCYNGFVMSWQ